MANLLICNPDVGFDLIVTASRTHKAEEVRGLYLKAIQKGLTSGADLFGTNSSVRIVKYFENLIALRNFIFPSATKLTPAETAKFEGDQGPYLSLLISSVMSADSGCGEALSCSLLACYSPGECMRILSYIVREEVAKTESINTLFR